MRVVITKSGANDLSVKLQTAISSILMEHGLRLATFEVAHNDIMYDIKLSFSVAQTPNNITGLMENLLRNVHNFNLTAKDLTDSNNSIRIGGTSMIVLGMLNTTDRRSILVTNGTSAYQITPELLCASVIGHKIGGLEIGQIHVESLPTNEEPQNVTLGEVPVPEIVLQASDFFTLSACADSVRPRVMRVVGNDVVF